HRLRPRLRVRHRTSTGRERPHSAPSRSPTGVPWDPTANSPAPVGSPAPLEGEGSMTHFIAAAGAPRMFAYIQHPYYRKSYAYPVIAWDNGGAPWIALDEAKGLTCAVNVEGYQGLSMTSDFDGPMASA